MKGENRMSTAETANELLGIEDLVELLGFPARGRLRQEGMEVGEGLYKKLVVRLTRNYLAPLHLQLTEAPGGMYQVMPAPGNQWTDAAWWLGHTYNLSVDQPVVGGPDDLLSLGVPQGEAPHSSLRQAVLANLWLAREVPGRFFQAPAGVALRKAVEDSLEVLAARSAA
jgi:hypothetical protein